MKTCPRCKIPKPEAEFNKNKATKDGLQGFCRLCYSQYYRSVPQRESRKLRSVTSEFKKLRAGYIRKRKYGLSPEDYTQKVLSQGGMCAICKSKNEKLCVDHNHVSKKIRGLLCASCNTALGMLKESVATAQALIEYLKSYPA